MALAQLKLRGVLDGDDPLLRRDVTRQDVEERRLAAARATADDDVRPRHDTGLQEAESALAAAAEADQVTHVEGTSDEPAYVHQGAVDRNRWDRHVHARSVGEASIAYGVIGIDSPAR